MINTTFCIEKMDIKRKKRKKLRHFYLDFALGKRPLEFGENVMVH